MSESQDKVLYKQPKEIKIPKTSGEINDSQYSALLSTYVKEIKHVEQAEKERQKLSQMEKIYQYSAFDVAFPYHMYLGKLQTINASSNTQSLSDYESQQLTTIKSFNRKRMYLIWLFYEKYDKLLNEEERDKRDLAEHTMFKYNFGLKCLGLTGLLYSLFRLRKPNRS